VQLGLTGLCVYEIDDPKQRDAKDDSSQLRQRVAELEGVIREMKNKPHPRWIQSGSNSEFEKWDPHSQGQTIGDIDASELNNSSASPSPRLTGSSSPDNISSPAQPLCVPPLPFLFPSSEHCYPSADPTPSPNPPSVRNPYQSTPSPTSDFSSAVATPIDEFPVCPPFIVADQHGFTGDFDFSSMFMSYPDLASHNEDLSHTEHPRPGSQTVSISQYNKPYSSLQEERHCGCLIEPSSYSAVLELSLGLRKTADILKRSAKHRMGAKCPLQQWVIDLDTFATIALGNTMGAPEGLPPSPQSRIVHNNSRTAVTGHRTTYPTNSRRPPLPPPALPGLSIHTLHPPDSTQTLSMSPSTYGDGFTSWHGSGMMR